MMATLWIPLNEYPNANITRTEVTNKVEGLLTPSHIWVFHRRSDLPLMIRQEFHDALVAIIRWLKDSGPDPIISLESIDILSIQCPDYPSPFQGNEDVAKRERLVVCGLPGIGELHLQATNYGTDSELHLRQNQFHLLYLDPQNFSKPTNYSHCLWGNATLERRSATYGSFSGLL